MTYDRFKQLWGALDAKGDSQRAYNKLEKLYSKEDRHYHNMSHVIACLDEFSEVRILADNPNQVELALWYHDAIYNTKSETNEKDSALLAHSDCVQNRISENFAKKVQNLILMTTHTKVPKSIDEKIIADVDLSSLGLPYSAFNENGKNIRKEYSWVPEKEFAIARSKFLQQILNRDKIYYTKFFQDKYEQKARLNLNKAISELKEKINL